MAFGGDVLAVDAGGVAGDKVAAEGIVIGGEEESCLRVGVDEGVNAADKGIVGADADGAAVVGAADV